MKTASVLDIAFTAALGAAFITPAAAQTYPVRPIRLIAPISAGGGAVVAARLLAKSLS